MTRQSDTYDFTRHLIDLATELRSITPEQMAAAPALSDAERADLRTAIGHIRRVVREEMATHE